MKLHALEYPYMDGASLFSSVASQPWAVFLDSGVIAAKPSTAKHADFDVLAIKPQATLVFEQGVTNYAVNGQHEVLTGDPITNLREALPEIELGDGDESYQYLPGALGYFAYDLAREYEDLPELASNHEALPVMAMGIYHVVLLIDHKDKKTYLLSLGESEQTSLIVQEWVDLLIEALCAEPEVLIPVGVDALLNQSHLCCDELRESMDIALYERCFNQVRRYTIEGDCYQVNLAKQFSCKVSDDAWATYRYLRRSSPAPYGSYMNFPFAQVLSNSPESFIQCRNRQVITSPIKGTRPRNHDDLNADREIAESLFNSEKDRAENLMIVDLMRNDLSKCCELNSVRVPKLFAVHSFANVHHLISTVTGKLKANLHSLDLLRHCFPGGSITGAPKIRAMEIIEELEPTRRGLYCGAIGYVGADGSLETNIAIRTIVVKDGVARYGAGGGLVIDSTMQDEYQEIIDKASMMSNALLKSARQLPDLSE